MTTIGGSIFCYNAMRYDYCLREALDSLLPICDQVVCVDAGSTDGTREMLDELSGHGWNHKLKIIPAEWKPVAGTDGAWLCDLANLARENLATDYHIGLQADEVLHPDDYPLIRDCAEKKLKVLCLRYNFWKDHRHLAPHGHVCGHQIIRMGRKEIKFGGDAECLIPDGTEVLRSVRIYHYGFIRRNFLLKARDLQTAWHGDWDERLKRAQANGRENDWQEECPFPEPLLAFVGKHPELMHSWLKERGFNSL